MYPVPPRWAGGGAVPISSLPGRAEREMGRYRATLVLCLPCLQNQDYDGVFPNCRDVNSGTERLKSSVRKARPCSPRWRRWRTVSLPGPWAVEEPAFLMADATPLSSNGLHEGSTWSGHSKMIPPVCGHFFQTEDITHNN